MKKRFICNGASENAIKWLKKNKNKIHDGGMSNIIIIEVIDDTLLKKENDDNEKINKEN